LTLHSGKNDLKTTTLQNKEGWTLYDGPDIKENNTLIKYLHNNFRKAAEVDWHFDNGEQNSIMDYSWLQYLSKVFCQGY